MKQNEERGTEVIIPHLAESLVSATVGKWLKKPGDYIREYEVLCELITDKVNVEMPAPVEGTLMQIMVQEGETAAVGDPICIIREQGTPHAKSPEPSTVTGKVESTETAHHRSRYSPAVLRLAKEYQIDIIKIKGTGLGGRITRKDVLSYIKNSVLDEAASPVPLESERKKPDTGDKNEEQRLISVTPVRNLIAERMLRSVSEIPHAWLMIEADVSNLVELRQKLKERFRNEEGVPLTFTPFVLKAIVNAIKEYPMLNSTWAKDNIVVKKDIHLSIAVGLEDSVVTPVIRNADRKTIAGLAIELDDLVKRARAGKLVLSELQGGTITFNNTGSFGSLLSQPIINYPQAAMITFESIVRKPVVIQDMIAIRSMANLCISLDHRVLDGMICGRFMQRVKHYLEQYDHSSVIF